MPLWRERERERRMYASYLRHCSSFRYLCFYLCYRWNYWIPFSSTRVTRIAKKEIELRRGKAPRNRSKRLYVPRNSSPIKILVCMSRFLLVRKDDWSRLRERLISSARRFIWSRRYKNRDNAYGGKLETDCTLNNAGEKRNRTGDYVTFLLYVCRRLIRSMIILNSVK